MFCGTIFDYQKLLHDTAKVGSGISFDKLR